MMGRSIDFGLPTINEPPVPCDVVQQDLRYKSGYQQSQTQCKFKIGDMVLVRTHQPGKLTPLYNSRSHRVIASSNSVVEILHPDGHTLIRHPSHLKLYSE